MLRRLLVGAALLIVALLLAAWLLSYFRTGKTHLGKPPANGTFLRWESSGPGAVRVLDGSVLKPDKPVLLTERFRHHPPKSFEVWELFDSLLDSLVGNSSAVQVTGFGVVSDDSHDVHSDKIWQLPAPSIFRGQSTYEFLDNRNFRSGFISSSRIGKVTVAGAANASRSSVPSIFNAKAGADVTISTDVVVAVDPTLVATLLVPWGTGSDSLDEYLARYIAEAARKTGQFSAEDGLARFEKQYADFLPTSPPADWSFDISPQSISPAPNRPTGIEIEIRAPTPGGTLLALELRDQDHPSNVLVSTLFGVEVPSPSSGTGSGTTQPREDNPPTAKITTPDQEFTRTAWDGFDKAKQQCYVDIPLVGEAMDAEDGSLTGTQLEWATVQSGVRTVLGHGEQITPRLYSTDCSGMAREITLTATDSQGEPDTDVRELSVTRSG